MKYLREFETEAQYEAAESGLILPNVSLVTEGNTIYYNPYVPHDYSQDYLTFIATESGTFKFSGNSINYSLDNGETWTELASDANSPTVNAGQKIMWKATGLTPTSSNGIGTFSSTGRFTVEGNSMSLLYGDDFKNQTSLSGKNYAFYKLFSGCTGMTSAENLVLPATTLVDYCYFGLFWECTNLMSAPILPATTLASNCYQAAFYMCTSLTTAPELPATTLTNSCYFSMFNSCTSLTAAPELPAATLNTYCYQNMFRNCTSLTAAPSVLPATTLKESCYRGMFSGCTSLTVAPELPATTLVKMCYDGMFVDCTNLNSITCLATNISASNCTRAWVSGVQTTNGTFTKAANMTGWTTGTSGIPENWTVVNAS